MQIQVKNLPKSEVLLTIEISADLFATYEEQAAKRVSEQIDIPGFRRGQAPKAFIIAHLGAEKFFNEVLNVALPASYYEAVKQKNLQVISRPQIKVLSRNPLIYEAHTSVLPDVKIKGLEKMKIKQKTVDVTEKEIDAVIKEMQRYRATYKPLERTIQKGDKIEIDFCGFDETGIAIDKTKSANHPLFVGEGTLVQGFEEQLVGMKAGEKKRFPITFPKDFSHAPLRGKKVFFETEVKRAEEPLLPEINEEFVEAIMGEKKPVAEFRQAVQQDLHRQKQLEEKRNRENELLDKLLAASSLDVPPLLIEEEIEYMSQDLRKDFEQRHIDFEKYIEKLKSENKNLVTLFTPEAEKRIRLRLILNYLFKTLNIKVAAEEIEKIAAQLVASTPEQNRPKIEEELKGHGQLYLRLQNNLMLEKLFAHFLN